MDSRDYKALRRLVTPKGYKAVLEILQKRRGNFSMKHLYAIFNPNNPRQDEEALQELEKVIIDRVHYLIDIIRKEKSSTNKGKDREGMKGK